MASAPPLVDAMHNRFEDADPGITTERYRRQFVEANGRTFHIMVHEFLSSDAAFMLLASTCSDVPGLRARIAELESENRHLRSIIGFMTEPASKA